MIFLQLSVTQSLMKLSTRSLNRKHINKNFKTSRRTIL